MKQERLEELFRRYMSKKLTDAEETEMYRLWLDPKLKESRAQILDDFYGGLPEDKDMTAEDADFIFAQIIKKEAPVHYISNRTEHRRWRSWAIAASVCIVAGLSGYFFFSNKKQPVPQQTVGTLYSDDIEAPETNRAMIMLANGQKVYLDSAANGSLTMQGNVKLVKLADGKIAYEATGTSSGAMNYNTLLNPRGSKIIDITLADGSRVWLNAGSSVTYPVAFTGNERKVSMEGEAYFEIAHDVYKPFLVSKGKTTIKVLGTHFNVNAYDDEADMRITLLQGAIQVINNQQVAKVKPGEQAIVKADKIDMEGAVNMEQVVAWKEGYFQMKGTNLASLMRQISRWYDVEVIYKSQVPQARFGGAINRGVNLSDVLNALEQYGIHSSLENGKIIVQ